MSRSTAVVITETDDILYRKDEVYDNSTSHIQKTNPNKLLIMHNTDIVTCLNAFDYTISTKSIHPALCAGVQ